MVKQYQFIYYFLKDFHKQSPVIYKHIEDLCLEYDINGQPITFDQFIEYLNKHLGDNTSRNGISHIFERMMDSSIKEITPESLHNIIEEVEKDNKLSLEDVRYMLKRIADPSQDLNLTLDEFYYIMTKKPSDVDIITPATKSTK